MGRKPKLTWRPKLTPELIEMAKKHLLAGYSYGSFAGRYRIPVDIWQKLTRESKELTKLNETYKEFYHDRKRIVKKYPKGLVL